MLRVAVSPRLADEMTTEPSPRTLAALSTCDQASGTCRLQTYGGSSGSRVGGGLVPSMSEGGFSTDTQDLPTPGSLNTQKFQNELLGWSSSHESKNLTAT